jgi:hypothetical protein
VGKSALPEIHKKIKSYKNVTKNTRSFPEKSKFISSENILI